MKAISPMIATVLIIAFTIAVGGIISIFMTNLTTTQTGEAEKAAAGTSECAGTYIGIINVSIVDLTNGGNNTANIIVHNPSKNSIYVTSAYDDGGNVNTTFINTSTGSDVELGLKLAPGEIMPLSAVNLPTANSNKVTLVGFCENSAATTNVSISGVCPKGGSCWPS